MQGPLLENLQVLDPARNRGMNLLRVNGPPRGGGSHQRSCPPRGRWGAAGDCAIRAWWLNLTANRLI